MIEAIAFDFGGTLFSTGKMGTFTPQMHDAVVLTLMANGELSRQASEAVYSSYIEAWSSRRALGGSLPERETSSLDLLRSALAVNGNCLSSTAAIDVLNSFHREESDLFAPLRGVLATLPKLYEDGYRLCNLTSFRPIASNPLPSAIFSECDCPRSTLEFPQS